MEPRQPSSKIGKASREDTTVLEVSLGQPGGNFETRGGPQNRAQGPSLLLGPPRPPHWAARPALPCWPDQPPLLFSVSLTPTHTSSLLKPPKPTPGSSRFPLHCLPTEPLPVPRFLPHQHSVAAHQTSGSLSCQHPQEELGFE